mmetsp:Transcript_103133/g.210326  ORF Transcript_103133/g.210326 Transcript_103133/m.210326 type:complete len:300 (+) Transcript_103133:287-1186(+)|eukprot:CAMPEP_0201258536 /NCGR_PEP_ID=MMETSP0853-20130426/2808_1 /ASSEMBLY_ACC=CAM_ASM_000640 /TAXON_ID=183588 /ORGANISM="Pseudo-nitzschia fraudulenta, Strain WWA7" /LENGTH=299 /DNA_ID=CAMNT_0047560099 /DNA_START=183 /DNA_END=1082 /DNA_ORIENTATION=+
MSLLRSRIQASIRFFFFSFYCCCCCLVLLTTPALGQETTSDTKGPEAYAVYQRNHEKKTPNNVRDEHRQQPNERKVKIELYYMPQCPGCRQLISTSFGDAFHTPGFSDMADVTFVPYANSRKEQHQQPQQQQQQQQQQQYQAGKNHKRVFDDTLESCALHAIGRKNQERQFLYIDCIDRNNNRDASRVDLACAGAVGLSTRVIKEIEACADSERGQKLAERNARQTDAMEKATYFPWIVVNRRHDRDTEEKVWRSLFLYVCGVYSGNRKSPLCPTGDTGNRNESHEDSDGADFFRAEQL